MKVAVDGGALCSPKGKQYGTYRFSTEFLQALSMYGKHNYTNYTFCDVPNTLQQEKVEYLSLQPSFGWMKIRLPLQLASTKPDVFLGLNQIAPWGFKGKKIIFSHGLSFHFFPEYYASDYKRLEAQMKGYIKDADVIIVSSKMVKEEMLAIDPATARKIKVLPFGIMPIQNKIKRKALPYFLYVGSDQPIKNVHGLLHSFTEFWKKNRTSRFRLILVGTNLSKLPSQVEQISSASYKELQALYAGAAAYVTCSFYESFNYPIVEALSAGCPVLALKTAIIPEQAPFVQIASNMEDLSFLMEKASQGKFEFKEKPDIQKVFNWETYIHELEKLYI